MRTHPLLQHSSITCGIGRLLQPHTYSALDCDGDVGNLRHGLAAICHQLRLQHHCRAEATSASHAITVGKATHGLW
jgi:hypothetical protein